MAHAKPTVVARAALLPVVLLILGLVLAGAADPDDDVLAHVTRSWTGDLDGIAERGFLRILTVHNPLYFSFDAMDQRGLAHDMGRMLEEHLEEEIGQVRSPTVVLIPVARDELLKGLIEGRGDLAAGNLSITPERQKLVDFSLPVYPDIDEIVVTGPGAPKISTFDELARVGLHLRESSSYFEHLKTLNAERKRSGKTPIPVETVDEYLEDYDLLEMVNAGILPAIVVDSHKVSFWARILPDIVVHDDLVISADNQVGWAVRKGSPQLLETLNAFAKKTRKGTLLGNMTLKRYLGSTAWLDNPLGEKHHGSYARTVELIKKYATRYDFDWIMIAAQAFQESRFDQAKRSPAGAVGIMQLLPSTAADPAVGIPDISTAEANIHAGVKYLRWLRENYFSSDEIAPLDRVLFSFAAYNAGPGNMNRARRKAAQLGFDPNRWFGNVEIGMYRSVSGEPASYVRNIYRYYVTYRRLEESRARREEALEDGAAPGGSRQR
jgi:membrane-bound lytic murein transglycosylase MltF